jgi:hypothetical protein
MKKAMLVLLGVSASTVGFVSCKKETFHRKEPKSDIEFEVYQKSTSNDTLNLYRTSPHGNKGEGKLGDD